eukprot:TRINITY_DN97189_c0_g1_i1.p1 TRINITY_DN97189_c0_g1~~TRINITY_DN97189_c0_g1_i1.p1  ORF type:complete len:460 (-),score=105.08 TRINITY_DN97189_c0_g1_i1:62-1351(-)
MGGPKGAGGGGKGKGGSSGGYWEAKGDGSKGKDKDWGKSKGGWKGDGGWWPDEDKGKGKGKDGKDGKGSKSKKGDEWRWKEDWVPRDRQEWVPKGKGESGKGEKGNGKRISHEGGKGQSEEPEGSTLRSQLSSSAPDFKPSGLFDYDAVSGQYWNWQPLVQEMPPLWREYADKDGEKYYYNSKTGLSQWERPAELDPPRPPEAPEPASSSAGEKGGRTRDHDGPGGNSSGSRRDREGNHDRDELRKLRSEEGGGKSEGKGKKGDRRRQGGNKKADNQNEPTFGPPGCNLFVFHLPDDWVDEDLLEYFAPHGTVVSAKVMKELGTGRSRGFGFVSYEDRISAATAIKKMQGYKILGKRLKVEFKKGEGESNSRAEADLGSEEHKSSGDDERLIGYLRAISAKTVVQSLKAAEGGARSDDEGRDIVDEDKD